MITREDVRHISHLARIRLSAQEEQRYQKDFQEILAYFDTLRGVDTTGVAPMTHSGDQKNVVRKDEALGASADVVRRLTALFPAAKGRLLQVASVLRRDA